MEFSLSALHGICVYHELFRAVLLTVEAFSALLVCLQLFCHFHWMLADRYATDRLEHLG